MSISAVVCEQVTKIYGTGHSAVAALRGVSFEMRKGEVCLIAGPSGCGKTTLLSILGGLLAPTSGRVKVLDQPLHALDDAALQRFRQQLVGFVFQAFNLVPSLTAVENVAVPLLLQGLESEQALARAREALRAAQLQGRDAMRPAQLSGGEKQRVAIARALVTHPPLLLCDEPTSALDGPTGQAVMALIARRAHEAGQTAIVVTHDERIFHYADRLVHMEDGRITGVEQ